MNLSTADSAAKVREELFGLVVARRVSSRPPSGTLGHCYIALFLAIYHLGYIAPAKLLYSKGTHVTQLLGTRVGVDLPVNHALPSDDLALKYYYFKFILLTHQDTKAQRNAEQ